MEEELTSTTLLPSSIGADYNPALCIICRKKKKGVKVRSTSSGRSKVIDAANRRKDSVLSRLSISECSSFVYHVTNECYKGYTLLKTLEQIQAGNEIDDVNMEVDHTDNMPASKMKK